MSLRAWLMSLSVLVMCGHSRQISSEPSHAQTLLLWCLKSMTDRRPCRMQTRMGRGVTMDSQLWSKKRRGEAEAAVDGGAEAAEMAVRVGDAPTPQPQA